MLRSKNRAAGCLFARALIGILGETSFPVMTQTAETPETIAEGEQEAPSPQVAAAIEFLLGQELDASDLIEIASFVINEAIGDLHVELDELAENDSDAGIDYETLFDLVRTVTRLEIVSEQINTVLFVEPDEESEEG
jgi:hypothetical protein